MPPPGASQKANLTVGVESPVLVSTERQLPQRYRELVVDDKNTFRKEARQQTIVEVDKCFDDANFNRILFDKKFDQIRKQPSVERDLVRKVADLQTLKKRKPHQKVCNDRLRNWMMHLEMRNLHRVAQRRRPALKGNCDLVGGAKDRFILRVRKEPEPRRRIRAKYQAPNSIDRGCHGFIVVGLT